jgi:hypothetical protein
MIPRRKRSARRWAGVDADLFAGIPDVLPSDARRIFGRIPQRGHGFADERDLLAYVAPVVAAASDSAKR